jgi:hypothetical protein
MTTDLTTTTTPSNVRLNKTNAPPAITMLEYGGLQTTFDYLNRVLFDGMLPDVFITYQRKAHSGGYFSPNRFTDRVDDRDAHHEIALNPDGFVGKSDKWIASILVHEMAHLWQQVFGRPSKRGYHNKEWAAKMESLGLMPSNSGMVGGKRTGSQMSHYVIPGGACEQAFDALAAAGWKLNLESTIHTGATKAPPSKLRYTCPICAANAWAKPDSKLICEACWIKVLRVLPWLDADKAMDLAELICRAEMLPQQIVASDNGEPA